MAFFFDQSQPSGFASTCSATRSCPSHEDPCDVSGTDLADTYAGDGTTPKCVRLDSHIILETSETTHQRTVIPDQDPVRLGTLI